MLEHITLSQISTEALIANAAINKALSDILAEIKSETEMRMHTTMAFNTLISKLSPEAMTITDAVSMNLLSLVLDHKFNIVNMQEHVDDICKAFDAEIDRREHAAS